MKTKKAVLVWGAIAFAIIIGVISAVPVYFMSQMSSDITRRQKYLLYNLDHQRVAAELRQFAAENGWSAPIADSEHPVFFPNDRNLSPDLNLSSSITSAKPNTIAVFDDRVELECGSGLLHYGIAVFKPGLIGYGQKQLGDGIWFYSENGRVPR